MVKLKPDKEIVALLTSGRSANISSAIKRLRIEGNTSYLPTIFKALKDNYEIQETRDTITGFLIDLKQQEVVQQFVDVIRDANYKTILPVLISACWQNGLDYSQYVKDFVDVFIDSDLLLAIESFTVIENMIFNLSESDINESIRKLKDAIPAMDNEKKKLAIELIHLFENQTRF